MVYGVGLSLNQSACSAGLTGSFIVFMLAEGARYTTQRMFIPLFPFSSYR